MLKVKILKSEANPENCLCSCPPKKAQNDASVRVLLSGHIAMESNRMLRIHRLSGEEATKRELFFMET